MELLAQDIQLQKIVLKDIYDVSWLRASIQSKKLIPGFTKAVRKNADAVFAGE